MVGLGVVGLVAALTALTANRVDEPYDELRVVDTRLSQEAPRGPIAIEASATDDSAFLAGELQAGTIYALRRHGREVVAPAYGQALGAEYRDEDGTGRWRASTSTGRRRRGWRSSRG